MRKTVICLLALLASLWLNSYAAIIIVPDDYATIQLGIDASQDGDTVLVMPGTYLENINFHGHDIKLVSFYFFLEDEFYIANTIIDGSDSGSVVTFNSGEDSTIAIIGFTIQNGRAGSGGGILSSFSRPTISHNMIKDNVATESGGGIHSIASNALIVSNTIKGNSAPNGNGGGIYIYGGDYLIQNNLIFNNSAANGGGLFFESYSHILINSTISANSATVAGGGIYSAYAQLLLANCILWGNASEGYWAEVRSEAGVTSFVYSDIGSYQPGPGNINLDPLFRDPANGDFHLMTVACGDPYDSPCIDAGNPGITDRQRDCLHGLGSDLSDMGAYGGGIMPEIECNYVLGDVNSDGIFTGGDIVRSVQHLLVPPVNDFPPLYSCDCHGDGSFIYPSGDVNGDCFYSGGDIIHGIQFIREPWWVILYPCPDCPPGGWLNPLYRDRNAEKNGD